MSRSSRGFTLIELLIVTVIIGLLAAIAIPNFIAMQNRAKEGSTKANMHTLQLAVEDYGVQNDGTYPTTENVTAAMVLLPSGRLKNPFTKSDVRINQSNANPGDLFYWGDGAAYAIRGMGKEDTLNLVLVSGR